MQDQASNKTVLVTGSNRGLGYGIVKILLSKGYKVVMCSRDLNSGNSALENLLKELPSAKDRVNLIQLDVSKEADVANAVQWVKTNFGQIDVLLNNAATSAGENELALKALEQRSDKSDITQAGSTAQQQESLELFDSIFATNVYGTLNISLGLLKEDLIRQNGKIITIASSTGNATRLLNDELKKELTNENVDIDQLLGFCQRYRKAIECKTVQQEGWIQQLVPVYSNSKLLTQVLNRALANHNLVKERGIQVYACCPGWVRTDLGGQQGARSIEEGARTPIFLVEKEFAVNQEIQGKFFYSNKVYDWVNQPVPNFFDENAWN